MDTVSFVLALIAALLITTTGSVALAYREHRGKVAAQAELARLVAEERPRAPHYAAGYDTGLVEPDSVTSSLETQAAE